MKIKLLIIMLFAFALGGYCQITSVSIVGSGAGGWPGEPSNPGPTDIHQMVSTDGINWSIEDVILSNGEIKFRANNLWDINWGDTAFPVGTGLFGGPNIISITGLYDVTFNSDNGQYVFSSSGPTPVVKLIGNAVSNPEGYQMYTADGSNYSINAVALLNGTAQFEMDGNAFGADTFPTGDATDPFLYIPVLAGTYDMINYNIETGIYSFVGPPVYPLISLHGTATADNDVDLITADGIHYSYDGLGTIEGNLKFRFDHNSATTYGNTTFPNGIALLDGEFIPISAGTWDVTFNLNTGEYIFSNIATSDIITIVGSGAGGWPGDGGNPGPYDIHQLTTEDGINYYIYNLALTDGEVKFRLNQAWDVNWGEAAFPSGTGVQGGPNIPTIAGNYSISFNRITGEYNFGNPLRMAIVGTGAGGWPTGEIGEIDSNQLVSEDGRHFSLNNITLTDGEVKFRQNNSWDVNWGGTSLMGILILDGPAIPVTAGNYSISMDVTTGAYIFADPLSNINFKSSDFSVYPNPTHNVWNFSSASENIELITVIDVLGKIVMTVSPKNISAVVDASGLNTGIYFARIATSSSNTTVKLVKN